MNKKHHTPPSLLGYEDRNTTETQEPKGKLPPQRKRKRVTPCSQKKKKRCRNMDEKCRSRRGYAVQQSRRPFFCWKSRMGCASKSLYLCFAYRIIADNYCATWNAQGSRIFLHARPPAKPAFHQNGSLDGV